MSKSIEELELKIQDILAGVLRFGYAMKPTTNLDDFGKLMKMNSPDPQMAAHEIMQIIKEESAKEGEVAVRRFCIDIQHEIDRGFNRGVPGQLVSPWEIVRPIVYGRATLNNQTNEAKDETQ